MNSFLKSKTWKLMRKQPDLKDVEDSKPKLKIRLLCRGLGSANKALVIEIKRAKWHRRFLLCQSSM